MRKILLIAYYELKRNIRDIKMLMIFILSPILLIFILGNSLDSFITLNDMPRPVVGYVNQDEGNVSKTFNLFIKQDSIIKIMDIKIYISKEEAENQMDLDQIDSIIMIPSNFSELINAGKQTEIVVYGQKNSAYVSAVVVSYVKQYNLNTALVQNNLQKTEQLEKINLEKSEYNSIQKYPKTIDYYSIQILLEVLLVCGVLGVSVVLRDYRKGMQFRINSLPVKKYQLLIGRIMGSIIYSFLAAIVTILFSKYFYNANWDGNVLIIGLAILLFVIIAVGLGAFIGSITRNYISSFGIIGLLVFILSASVGAFSPKMTMKEIALFSPNLYTKNIIMASIFKLNHSIIIQGFISLGIMIVIIYGSIILLEGRRKYEDI